MSKKGQVFILAAILLSVVLFSLAAIRNKSEQRQIKGDFEALSENYQIEASRLINSAITQPGIDPHDAFKSFSMMFTSYAKGKNPEYGLIYILSFEDKIQVTNFLNRDIKVIGCGVGGAEYSVTIPGGFDNINANLNFEGFNIKAGIVPADLQFVCGNISELSGDQQVGVPCAYLYPGESVTEMELAVMIDDAPYKSCIKKGVPEIMQVGIMRQGEQAKVSATGSCISEDFCEGLDQGQCGTCGGDVCFWWPIGCSAYGINGLCLGKYAYPSRDPVGGSCPATTCKQLCIGSRIFYTDDCDEPIGTSIKDCEKTNETNEVCRNAPNAQCCTKLATKSCCGEDICWYNNCDNPALELTESCEKGEGCRGADAECCDLRYTTKCYENKAYYYSDCETREELIEDCDKKGKSYVCRDESDGLDKAKCCKKDKKLVCHEGDVYYLSDCGTIEDLKEDCDDETEICEDEECVDNLYKQLTCKCERYSGDGWTYAELFAYCKILCGEGASCKEGTLSGGSGDRECMCYNEYLTSCSENPSCGSDTPISELGCIPVI